MSINYHDKTLSVMYLQIFLKEYFGLSVRKRTDRLSYKVSLEGAGTTADMYEITGSYPIKVTGYYNEQTYSSLALYMAYSYPREGFPYRWRQVSKDSWESYGFIERSRDGTSVERVKLKTKENKIIEGILEVVDDKYVIVRDDEKREVICDDREILSKEIDRRLISVISTNMENLFVNNSIAIPDRVLSYVFNEVVTSKSTPEEIIRVKKLLHESIIVKDSLSYDKDLFNKILNVQRDFVKKYSSDNDYPSQYEGFKVTGYVDPWTEILLKGGAEVE